jgi:hypothetical protein
MTNILITMLLIVAQEDAAPKPDAARPPTIERAVQSMKAAKEKLAAGQTGAPTQDLQKQVLAALDELLKTPPQPPSPNQSGSGGGGQSQDSQRSSSQDKDQSKSSAQGKPSGVGGEQQAGEQRNRSQADDSEERTGPRRTGVAAPLPRRRLEVDVWGHLPEKVREQLLNGYGERMVPQYEALVRKFYESLADTAAEPDRPASPNR